MGFIIHCFLIAISIVAIRSLFIGDLGNNLLSAISKRDDSAEVKLRTIRREIPMKKYLHGSPVDDHVNTDEVQKKFAKAQTVSEHPRPSQALTKMPYHKDGVLNYFRRKATASSSTETSSSVDLQNWKDEWRQLWIAKKLEALNETTIHGGDKINMIAARPWGVPCGDPFMHDMPWGTCMLAQECEAEFRIYRGDFKCGRTEFICCGILLTSYDNYQGFDMSFDTTSFETDSWELRQRVNTKSKEKKRKEKDKRKRKRERDKRKRKIKRTIKRIIKQIKKILDKISKKGTKARKRKTKMLKNFLKYLKKKYKRDRQSVKTIHYDLMNHIDDETLKRLKMMEEMNKVFMKNVTLQDIILNGKLNYNVVRAMFDKYPEMLRLVQNKIKEKEMEGTKKPQRRFMQQPAAAPLPRKDPGYLQYDIEYGLLYY